MLNKIWQWVRGNAVFVIILLLLTGGFVFLKQDSSVASVAELDAALQNGRPVVLDFFSNT
ncbi:MAG: hypothetical protein KKA73_13485 [Chloroflexi bacterium]|nr:hypothetical protein [Chloroflexota bacterium]MBU1748694.1 hypothetical protein [Chloroflexota bacterium]